jgi:glutamyl-tRNA synthetase
LFTRHHQGVFLLRIEDTDRERSRDEYVHAIMEGLRWLGLEHDEGPYFQSARTDLYLERAEELVRRGHAYHCRCTPHELEAKREQAQLEGRKPAYDRTCRDRSHSATGQPSVIRLRAPIEGETLVDDMIRGPVRFAHAEIDDLVLVRSDRTPTFYLVGAVDDIDMRITHVLRGEDHLTNTPKQILIMRGLGGEPPRYGHLPLIVGGDRARLSKRHGATAVEAFRDDGFLPDAVVNYLARLGWSHGDQEIFTREELIRWFDVNHINRSAAAFDMEKFVWVNFQHLKAMDDTRLAAAVSGYLDAEARAHTDSTALARAVGLLKERSHTLVELARALEPFVCDEIAYDAKAVAKHLGAADLAGVAAVAEELSVVDPWALEAIEAAFGRVLERLGLKLGKLAQPVRVALTGATVSPGIFEVCAALGRDRTLARLRRVCELAPGGRLPIAPDGAAQPSPQAAGR